MANLNLDDDFVPFFKISSQNGREESISSVMEKNPKHANPALKANN